MISKILLPLLLVTSVHAFDKDFKTVNERVPLEFDYLFESMKLMAKSPAERLHLVGIAKDLDQNLGYLQKEHIFFLMKSEVTKTVLEYKHDKVRSFAVTTALIKKLEEDLKTKEGLLNPFSKWLWRSIIAELKHREKLGIISEQSFNPTVFTGAKLQEAQRFSRYLNYILPWIDKMDSLSAVEFNALIKEVGLLTLQRLNDRSLLFRRFASTATSDTKVNLFNIPSRLLELHPEEFKRIHNDAAPLSLSEESEKAKTQAREDIENATPDDLSSLSDEISEEVSKELDKNSP